MFANPMFDNSDLMAIRNKTTPSFSFLNCLMNSLQLKPEAIHAWIVSGVSKKVMILIFNSLKISINISKSF
jgi:hypothetical protein